MITFLPTKNINVSADFYSNTLGFPLFREQSGGKCLIFDIGSGMLGVCEYSDGRALPFGEKGVCISFVLGDKAAVDEKYSELLTLGVKTDGEPKLLEKFGVYSFFFSDPFGCRLEYQCFL